MKEKWLDFNTKAFTFAEFRNSIENECLHGEDPDKVAENCLDTYIKEGYVEETVVGDETWFIRTGKKLPPKK